MSIHVNDTGVWKTVDSPKVNNNGDWVTPTSVWINDNGTWKQAWPDLTGGPPPGGSAALSNRDIFKGGNGSGNLTAGIRIKSNGSVYNWTDVYLETWLLSGAAADYEIRATDQGSAAMTGGTFGSWLSMGVDNSWNLTAGEGFHDGEVFFEIRNASTLVVVDTAIVTFTIENSTL